MRGERSGREAGIIYPTVVTVMEWSRQLTIDACFLDNDGGIRKGELERDWGRIKRTVTHELQLSLFTANVAERPAECNGTVNSVKLWLYTRTKWKALVHEKRHVQRPSLRSNMRGQNDNRIQMS